MPAIHSLSDFATIYRAKHSGKPELEAQAQRAIDAMRDSTWHAYLDFESDRFKPNAETVAAMRAARQGETISAGHPSRLLASLTDH